MLALVFEDVKIRILSADSFDCLGILCRHEGMIRCIDFSPAGRFLVSGGTDKRAILWDVDHLAHVRDFEQEKPVWEVRFSSAGDNFVTNDTRGCLRKWDVSTGTHLLSIDVCAFGVCFLVPDSPKIVSCASAGLGSPDCGFVGCWNHESGVLLTKVSCDPSAIALSPLGDSLVIGYEDGRLGIYQFVDETPSEDNVRFFIAEPGNLTPRNISFSLDGTKIACRLRDYELSRRLAEVRVWELASGQLLIQMDVGYDDHRVTFSPGGDSILATDSHGFQIIDICSGESKFNMEGTDVGVFSRPSSVVLM